MEYERAGRVEIHVDFAGVEKADLAVSLRHHDGGIGERLQLVMWSELSQHQAPEAPFEKPDQLPLYLRLVPHTYRIP